MKINLVIFFLYSTIIQLIYCGKMKSEAEKNTNKSYDPNAKYLIFQSERKIYEKSDLQSKILGVCQPLQLVEVQESKPENYSRDFQQVICNAQNGWIPYDLDIEYGSGTFFTQNIEKFKNGYNFKREMGGSYDCGDLSVGFNFKSLLINVNQGGGNLVQEYSDFKKITPKKWSMKNNFSELVLERLDKQIKFIVVSGNEQLTTAFNNQLFEPGSSCE